MKLADVPFVDNHVHPLARRQPTTPAEFRAQFGEAHDSSVAADHLTTSVVYHWALRQLGGVLSISPTAEEILEERARQGFLPYARTLVSAANIGYLLLDTGFPPADVAYQYTKMANLLDVKVGHILRIEMVLEQMIPEHETMADLVDDFDARLDDELRRGTIAFKSIAAYRTGLQIGEPSAQEAAAALAEVRKNASRPFRLSNKTLIDFFVHHALGVAAGRQLPVQFHTGYGDPDLDLRLANPLHLRPLFEDQRYREAPIVMLHASYPYTGEAAYLAAVYPNAYLDIAYSLPPLGYSQLVKATATALGVAPASKIMASSDGVGIPEHYWLGAVRAREVLEVVLNDSIRFGELDSVAAEHLGQLILSENAYRVYHLQ